MEMSTIQKVKLELKALAAKITTHRAGRKQASPTHAQYDQAHDVWLSREYRHKHIAYCLARGTAYEQIEKPCTNNKPCWRTIEGYLKSWGFANETVCANS